MFPITENVLKKSEHTTFYLACGPRDGPVAPDMRGYGRSTVHPRHEDYALPHSVNDMLELLQSTGRERALWIGHDWGSPVVWSIAAHHPERCIGVASLCIPYLPDGFTPDNLVPLVDRTVYPESEYPAGQWDYQFFYQDNFELARTAFERNVTNAVKAMFRRGDPAGVTKPSRLATIRRDGGWFGGAGVAPDLPLDPAVLTETDLHAYAAALERNGFFGPDSWYMNPERNEKYAKEADHRGMLSMPVLFLHGAYDTVCATVGTRLADPMRHSCADLTEVIVQSGHWMAQEQPVAVNRAVTQFIGLKLPGLLAAGREPDDHAGSKAHTSPQIALVKHSSAVRRRRQSLLRRFHYAGHPARNLWSA